MDILDSAEIDMPCPQCGHENTKTLGWLKHNKHMVCAGCSEVIAVDSSAMKESFKAVGQKLEDLGQNLSRLGKRR